FGSLLFNEIGIRGEIPASIGNLVRLKTFTASNKGISGTIPTSMANLVELSLFQIHRNNLSGTIPANVFGQCLPYFLWSYIPIILDEIPEDLKNHPKSNNWNLDKISLRRDGFKFVWEGVHNL